MENKNSKLFKRLSRLAKFYILGGVAVSIAAIGATIYIVTTPKLKDTCIVMKDGKKVENLTLNDISIVPGTTSSYTVTLLSRMRDNYKVLVSFEGVKSALTSKIHTDISTEDYTYSSNLTNALNSGYQVIGSSFIDEEKGVEFTISYEFDNDITEDIVAPFDLSLSFKIEH